MSKSHENSRIEPEPAEIDLGWKRVRCSVDGEEYVCTPYSDYYNAVGVDESGVGIGGVCEAHLLSEAGFEPIDPVEPAGPGMGFIGEKLAPNPSGE